MQTFVFRDRGSGFYLHFDAANPEHPWRMVKDLQFALMVQAPDADDANLRRGVAAVYEFFGENKANGFELVPQRVT